MDEVERTEDRIKALRIIADTARRIDRIPQKKDFDPNDLIFAKKVLGPLPRALEIAGMKSEPVHFKKKKEKRVRRRTGEHAGVSKDNNNGE